MKEAIQIFTGLKNEFIEAHWVIRLWFILALIIGLGSLVGVIYGVKILLSLLT